MRHDVDRLPIPRVPPVSGAQWDEVRGVWVRWQGDVDEGAWFVVEETADGVSYHEDTTVTLPALLVQELVHAAELDLQRDDVVLDLRAPEPVVHVPGAQWNEIRVRWERWDEASGDWVEATGS